MRADLITHRQPAWITLQIPALLSYCYFRPFIFINPSLTSVFHLPPVWPGNEFPLFRLLAAIEISSKTALRPGSRGWAPLGAL